MSWTNWQSNTSWTWYALWYINRYMYSRTQIYFHWFWPNSVYSRKQQAAFYSANERPFIEIIYDIIHYYHSIKKAINKYNRLDNIVKKTIVYIHIPLINDWPLSQPSYVVMHFNRDNFFRGNIIHIFTFYAIPPHLYDTGSWNPFSSKNGTYLFYMVNIMAVDVLAT